MKIRSGFLALADMLHHLTAGMCAVLLATLFAAQITIVILRYAFGVGFLELQDVVSYSFAMLVVLGIPVALTRDAHVRVDILRSGQTPAARRRWDHAGILLLMLPVFGMTLWLVLPHSLYSWSIREGGVETGGLPGFFIVKTALPLACALMLLQGAALMLRRDDFSGGDTHGD